MIEINLLPWQKNFKKNVRLIILILVFFSLCAALVIFKLMHYHAVDQSEIAQLKTELVERQQRIIENTVPDKTKISQEAPKPILPISKLIKINYAHAEPLKALLMQKIGNTSDGIVLIADKRTNALLIQAKPEDMALLQKLISQLDIPVKQVQIEARIVNIDEDYEKDLGVRFGVTSGRHISGSLSGANELSQGKAISAIDLKNRLNLDMPVANPAAGHIGLAVMPLVEGTLLDLELSALESAGHADVISAPRLMTANYETATIEAGEEIPYEESVSQGVTATVFKKAVLKLEVTPQITEDGQIIMKIKANQDKRSTKEVKGVPAIDTRQIETQVRIKNAQTVVLGGIYERVKADTIERIPFLGELPGIGLLFRHQKFSDSRRELLVFVTPKVIN